MTNSLEARRLADGILQDDLLGWEVEAALRELARSHKALDAECERLRALVEEIQRRKTTTAEHALEATEAQLRAMTQSRDEWKHRYGQMDDSRITAEAELAKVSNQAQVVNLSQPMPLEAIIHDLSTYRASHRIEPWVWEPYDDHFTEVLTNKKEPDDGSV